MYYVIPICIVIGLAFWFMMWLLNKHEKAGKWKNEIEHNRLSKEVQEEIRKTHVHSSTLNRKQRDARMHKYTSGNT